MRNTRLLGLAVTTALLAGCSGAGSPIPVANMGLTPTRQGAITSLREIRARYADVAIEPQEPFVDVAAVNAPHGNQTIVSGFNGVSVWGANGRLNALLTTGVTNAEGIATDAAENLYVVNAITNNVLVYPKPYNKLGFALSDFGEDPNGVAVSNAGVVAVTSLYNESTRGPGSVSFYAKGATAPCATISDPNWREMGFDAFDGSGNLYVNGVNTAGSKVLVGRISGGCSAKSIKTLHMGYTPRSLGGMQVVGGKLVMSDPAGDTLYTFAPAFASLGSAISTIVLPHAAYPIGFALTGTGKLWVGDFDAFVYECTYPATAVLKANKNELVWNPYGIALNPGLKPSP